MIVTVTAVGPVDRLPEIDGRIHGGEEMVSFSLIV